MRDARYWMRDAKCWILVQCGGSPSPVMSSGGCLFCHSREGGNPVDSFWIPAFAGMTVIGRPSFPWVAGIRNRWKTSSALY